MTLLPPEVALWEAIALTMLPVATSGLTAAVGVGGGVIMLAAMAQVLPVAALIPVHGVVQLGSNLGRTVLLVRAAKPTILVPFAIGAALGAGAGGMLVTGLPAGVILVMIGAFVSVSPWLKVPPMGRGGRAVMAGGGFFATLLTMFVGATGPFVLTLLRPTGLAHRALVATAAMAMSLQHGLKVVAFGLFGFAFAEWVPLMGAIIGAGFLGTLIGARLHNLPQKTLRRALDVVLTLIGLQLPVRGTIALAA